MSRGLGTRQRQILDVLEATPHGWLELRALATTRSEYVALHRAAIQLEAAGMVWLDRKGRGRTIARPGVHPVNTPEWNQVGTPLRNGATKR